MPFSVSADQSDLAAYKAGDMLVGSTLDVKPTSGVVNISARHVMSRIKITLKPGNGFTANELADGKASVRINGLKTQATVNLSTATVTATGSATSVTPHYDNGSYEAIIVPQTMAEGNLITVTVGGHEYNLVKAIDLKGGKEYPVTVTLTRTNTGINVGITSWEDDGIDYGGTAE